MWGQQIKESIQKEKLINQTFLSITQREQWANSWPTSLPTKLQDTASDILHEHWAIS